MILSDETGPWERLAYGAVAGLVGTMVLQSLRAATQDVAPQLEPPLKDEPGKFVASQAERVLPESVQGHISDRAESVAGQALGIAYGMSFGALYSSLNPSGTSKVRDGLLLGVSTWAAGYLGWLPTTGLIRPVWKHEPKQMVTPLVEHAFFGVAAVAAYHWLRDKIHG